MGLCKDDYAFVIFVFCTKCFFVIVNILYRGFDPSALMEVEVVDQKVFVYSTVLFYQKKVVEVEF